MHRQRQAVHMPPMFRERARMAFGDTYAFVSELVGAISREERLIRALYGDDVTSLLNDAEEALFRIYLHDDDEPERKEKIIFCIGGTSRLLLMNPDEHGIRAASELIRTVFNLNENRT